MFEVLRGIRVLDLTTVVLGPYATQMLGDFGAEVLKIEPPGGDNFRYSRPGRDGGAGAGFLNLNRNKASLVLDLKQPEDYATLSALVRQADVFVHNMRPGTSRELKVDEQAIRAIRPDIAYCSARGYGAGPRADEPAYDDCIQAASGLAALNADADGTPRFVRSVLCDKIAGLHLAFSVAMALLHRERTGEGLSVDTPMLETMISFLLTEHLGGRSYDPPIGAMGYPRLFSPDRRPFRTSDGWIAILPYSAAHWQRFLRLAGHEKLAKEPWLADSELISARIDLLYRVVAEVAGRYATAKWLEMLRGEGIPCAPVRNLDDLLDDPELAASGLFETIDHPEEGRLRKLRAPFAVRGAGQSLDRAAPVLDGARAEMPEPWPAR